MPLRQRRIGVVLALLALSAGACVSTEELDGSSKPTPTTTAVPPVLGSFGADVELGGVTATVVSVSAFDQSPNGVPRVEVVMRAENLQGYAQHNPDVQLICNETANTGDWFLGSTWEPNADLPVNAVTQGQVIIGFPLKGDNPEYPVVTCTGPRLRLTVSDARTTLPKVVDIPIDDSVMTE